MLSTVIPVFNEVKSLEQLHAELVNVASTLGEELDVVFVDDGSTDGSWVVIQQLARRDPRVRGIRFRRNFGKASALSAGFKAARGEVVMTLDADLQDDPAEIPKFLEQLKASNDVVSGWKQIRYDPWNKVAGSRAFNWLVSRLTGVKLHDHNCGMKCYRKEVLQEVRLYGELHRFVPVLAHARGFKIGEVVIKHRPRQFGRSKYGPGRILRGLLDLLTIRFLTGFGQRPQHLLGGLGLASLLAGGSGMLYLAGYWLMARLRPDWKLLPLHDRPAVIYSVAALLLGAQLLSVGLLAEMILAHQGRHGETYAIAEQTQTAAAVITRTDGDHAS